ncbi:hypothetical protein PMAYCL1PPCAC_09956, partial [Pristionchus mayeri]
RTLSNLLLCIFAIGLSILFPLLIRPVMEMHDADANLSSLIQRFRTEDALNATQLIEYQKDKSNAQLKLRWFSIFGAFMNLVFVLFVFFEAGGPSDSEIDAAIRRANQSRGSERESSAADDSSYASTVPRRIAATASERTTPIPKQSASYSPIPSTNSANASTSYRTSGPLTTEHYCRRYYRPYEDAPAFVH